MRCMQVQQGLIWVWAESGGDAFLESTQRGPVVNPLKQTTPPDQFTSSYINYVRDLPGNPSDVCIPKKDPPFCFVVLYLLMVCSQQSAMG